MNLRLVASSVMLYAMAAIGGLDALQPDRLPGCGFRWLGSSSLEQPVVPGC
jgi:hypothetical protein